MEAYIYKNYWRLFYFLLISFILIPFYSSYDRVLVYNKFVCSSNVELVKVRPLIFQSTNQEFDQLSIDAWIKLPTTITTNLGLLILFMDSNQYLQLLITPEYQLLIKICLCYSLNDCLLNCLFTLTSIVLSNVDSEYIVLSIKIQNFKINYSLYKKK